MKNHITSSRLPRGVSCVDGSLVEPPEFCLCSDRCHLSLRSGVNKSVFSPNDDEKQLAAAAKSSMALPAI